MVVVGERSSTDISGGVASTPTHEPQTAAHGHLHRDAVMLELVDLRVALLRCHEERDDEGKKAEVRIVVEGGLPPRPQ